MAEQPAGERTEDATPRRKQDARKKGTVARSTDLTGALVMFAVAMVLPAAGTLLSKGVLAGFVSATRATALDASPASIQRSWVGVAAPSMTAMALLIGVAMVTGVVANVAQVGFVLSPEVLQPNFAKLNPVEGIKRLFSPRSSVEGLKALAKSFLFGSIVWVTIRSNQANLVGLAWVHPKIATATAGEIVHQIVLRISLLWLALSGLDYFFQKKQVDKQLKMTKEELKREMKEQEGSPEMKGERYRRRRKLMKGRMLDKVKTADAIITNPTHYSIAIKYDRSEHHAPIVVAKGVDFLAFKIREIAKENRVPIVPNPPLARALYKQCEIGDFVPRDLFLAVAEVLAYVYQTVKSPGMRRSG